MRYILIVFVSLIAACATKSNDPYKKMDRLVGLWQMDTDEGSLYEEWWQNKKGSLSGRTYMINGSDTMVFERVELERKDSGIYYIATVKGQNSEIPTDFKMIASNDSAFTFENKTHDFPQRIIYCFVNTDSLVARIEGDIKGEPKSRDYFYRRVKK
jgi:hypothetical protein